MNSGPSKPQVNPVNSQSSSESPSELDIQNTDITAGQSDLALSANVVNEESETINDSGKPNEESKIAVLVTGSTSDIEEEVISQTEPIASNLESNSAKKSVILDGVGNQALLAQFSPAPDRVFQSSLTLSLSCASPTAEIRYSLGEESLDENSLLYNPKEKIFLTQTTVVSARAFEKNSYGPLLSAEFVVRKPVWQEIEPSDQSDATPHKHRENLVALDGWRSAGASVRGKLHAHRGLWREDSFALANISAGQSAWSVIAVSDGAGSAPLSRVGSRLACEQAISSLQTSLGQIEQLSVDQQGLINNELPALREALVQSGITALNGIRAEGEKREKPISSFAATLLILVRREWNGMQLCAALQVGDGSIALLDAGGLTLLGVADHGQHSSETRFLTTGGIEADLHSRVIFSIKKDILGIAVMSDGVSDDYFPEDKRLTEVFDAVLPLVRDEQNDAGEALLQWLGYEKKGSSDDRTLVVVWPPSTSDVQSSIEQTPTQLETSDGETQSTDSNTG